METLLGWINTNQLDKLRNYIQSLTNINSVLIYDEETDLNLLHIISANDSSNRDDSLRCLLEENDRIKNKPKLDINRKSGPGNDCWTACHLACCYGNVTTLEILLDNGADPELLDKNGNDALDIATAFDQYRCVDLMRRKMKSKTFSKADLNKSCDTVFYSFCSRNRSVRSMDNNDFAVNKVDAEVQTSGQFNSTFDATFKTTANDSLGSVSPADRPATKTITNRSAYIEKAISSASKVLDRHRKEFEDVRRMNSTFINEYTGQSYSCSKSLNKTAIMNELKKDLTNSTLINRSVDRKSHQDRRSSAANRSSNVIKNLRTNFGACRDSGSSDDSIEPFDATISTIALGDNKQLYIDNEFSVSLINETRTGLLSSQIETSDSSSEFLDLFTEDFDSTLKNDSAASSDAHDGGVFSTCMKRSPTLSQDVDSFDDHQIFNELIKLGYKPGPVNANTRSVYAKKLKELKKLNARVESKASKLPSKPPCKLTSELSMLNISVHQKLTIADSALMFSKPLRELMTGKFDFKLARQIEMEFVQSFENERASSKKFFNYLLLDPRITQNLCRQAAEDNPQLISQLNCSPHKLKGDFNYHFNLGLFKLFILAIFYIGKGQGNRPYMHLYDAAKTDNDDATADRQASAKKRSNIAKLNKIREVWQSGHGVISLHCYQNISSIESLTRECFMIDTIGIKFLTNIQIGQNRIKSLRWTQYKKDMLGAYLLYKAYNVLLVNGERQLKKADILN